MRLKKLSLCLSAVIILGSSAFFGAAVRASETAGEGATAVETAPAVEENAGDSQTDAAGNVITPQTAAAIENADLGVTNITGEGSTAPEASDTASSAEAALQTPDSIGTEMNKSTIGAAFDSSYQFNKEDSIVFVTEAAAVKAEPSDEAQNITSLEKYSSIRLTGSNDMKYWEVSIDGGIGYLDSSVITREEAVIEQMKEDDIRKEETEAISKQEQEDILAEKAVEVKEDWAQAVKEERRSELANQTRNLNWDGPVLSRSKGSVYGPSGKETYYNLNMSGCVRNMNRRGYYYDVWVRNDGCKMFGDYIMCAANLGVHPFGSLVECSLGTCIVVDTGGFAAGNPNQLDIAVTW